MDNLSYKDLQAKARELGIKANQKKDALVSALMEASVSTSAPPPTAAAEPAATTAVAPAAAAKPAAVAAQAPAPAVAAPAPVVVSIPTKAKSPAAAAAVGGAERAGKGGSRERDGARDRDGRERSRHRDGRDRDRRDRDRDRSGRDGGHDRSRRRERDGGHDRHRHRDERDRRPKKEGEGGGAESGGGAAAEGGEGKPREERSKRSRSGSRSRSHSRHKKHRRRRDRSGSESDDSGDRRRRKKKKKKKKKKSSLFTDAPPNLAAMMAQINPALLAQMPAQMQMMAAQLGGNPAAAVQMPPMGMGLPLGMPPMMGMGRGMGMGAAPRPYMKAAAFGGGGGLGGGGLGGGGGPGTGANGGGGSDPQTKPSRELYIGNMPEMSIPEQLKVFITSAMEQGGMTTGPGTPIVTVRCSAKFAFCEFRSIEECNLAMNMNGITYNGRVLNIGRPRQYTGPQTVSSTWGEWCAQKGVVNPIGGNAGIFHSAPLHKGGDAQTKNYRELYIGNCPEGITEPQLIKFVSDAMALAKLTTAEGSPVIQVRACAFFAVVAITLSCSFSTHAPLSLSLSLSFSLSLSLSPQSHNLPPPPQKYIGSRQRPLLLRGVPLNRGVQQRVEPQRDRAWRHTASSRTAEGVRWSQRAVRYVRHFCIAVSHIFILFIHGRDA